MKILSEEDGDTIMNDHFEEDEPMNTNIDKRLQEILDTESRFNPNDLTDVDWPITAIHSAFKDAGYINKDEMEAWQTDFKKRWNAKTGAEWLERFTKELMDYDHGLMKKNEDGEYEPMLVRRVVLEAARRAGGIEEDSNGD